MAIDEDLCLNALWDTLPLAFDTGSCQKRQTVDQKKVLTNCLSVSQRRIKGTLSIVRDAELLQSPTPNNRRCQGFHENALSYRGIASGCLCKDASSDYLSIALPTHALLEDSYADVISK